MGDYSDDETYEDEFVDADLPNLRHTKFDETIDEGSDISSSSELPVPTHTASIPEVVKTFVANLLNQIRQQNATEIHYLYENHFNRITDKFYKNAPWPHVDVIKTLPNPESPNKTLVTDKDTIFVILYKELYYRHIYSKLQPTVDQRIESWQNYCDLFDFLLKPNTPADIELQLPNQWLWDIVDEFIYQFQTFSQYRYKLKAKSDHETGMLKAHPEAWNVNTVIGTLSAIINKSKIVQTLENEKKGETVDEATHDFDTHTLYKMLGYFSIISLLRTHCLLGVLIIVSYLALKTLEPLDITKKGLHTRVTACHITLYYYLGFSYLMMRRYSDAIKTFSAILLYINRTKQYHTRSYQYDEIVKKNEQMYALLAITVSLCPQRIDENVHAVLREKYADKLQRMQRGDVTAFEEVFAYACPKFIIPSPPAQEDTTANYNQEALRLQQKLFLNEVKQQTLVTTIRSYLKLYSTISTAKLSNFLKADDQGAQEAEQIKTILLCYKHKTRNLAWNGGSPLSGKWTASSDVDFYVDKDMVHILDAKVTRRYGEYFIRNINKFEEIIRDVSGQR